LEERRKDALHAFLTLFSLKKSLGQALRGSEQKTAETAEKQKPTLFSSLFDISCLLNAI